MTMDSKRVSGHTGRTFGPRIEDHNLTRRLPSISNQCQSDVRVDLCSPPK